VWWDGLLSLLIDRANQIIKMEASFWFGEAIAYHIDGLEYRAARRSMDAGRIQFTGAKLT
jgi:hypothetical protein